MRSGREAALAVVIKSVYEMMRDCLAIEEEPSVPQIRKRWRFRDSGVIRFHHEEIRARPADTEGNQGERAWEERHDSRRGVELATRPRGSFMSILGAYRFGNPAADDAWTK